MIFTLSEKIASFFVASKRLAPEKYDWAVYILQIKFQFALFLIAVLILSIFFDIYIEAIFIMLGLFPLRSRIGGYHAKTLFRCLYASVIVLIIGIYLCKFLVYINVCVLTFALLLFSIINVFLAKPCNHSKLHLSKEEIDANHKTAKLTVLCQGAFAFVFLALKAYIPLTALIVGMSLSVCIMHAGKIKRKEEQK